MLSATLGGELRRPATPPAKSATPRVAADPRAAAGERSWFKAEDRKSSKIPGAAQAQKKEPARMPAPRAHSGWLDGATAPERVDHVAVAAHREAQMLGVVVLLDVAVNAVDPVAHLVQ